MPFTVERNPPCAGRPWACRRAVGEFANQTENCRRVCKSNRKRRYCRSKKFKRTATSTGHSSTENCEKFGFGAFGDSHVCFEDREKVRWLFVS